MSPQPTSSLSDTSDLTLLGRSEFHPASNPDEAKLESFPNRNQGRNYVITLDYPDFASLCPVTGQPDSAHLKIVYLPDDRCIETKSLKFYLNSFRNTKAFNEDIVNRILSDIVSAAHPKQVVVQGQFVPRGGIRLTCEARYPAVPDDINLRL